MATSTEVTPHHAPPAAPPVAPAAPRRRWRRVVLLAVLGAGLVAGLAWGVPYVRHMLSVTSTDDAFVNGHVTYISARVQSNVDQVFVDDNQFVEPGTLLLKLDPTPFQVAVAQKTAALEVARADLNRARADVQAQAATARRNWMTVLARQDQVKSGVAALRAAVATLKSRESSLTLARRDYQRLTSVAGAAAPSELDRARTTLEMAEQDAAAAREQIAKARADLGLGPAASNADPAEVPRDIEETANSVQAALADTALAAAQLGLNFRLSGLTPKAMRAQFEAIDPSGDVNKIVDQLVEKAPVLMLAANKVRVAEQDVKQAELELGYAEVRAPVAGVVARRSVNPGNQVQRGQALMSIRPLDDVWIDANFKETQLDQLRIGQPVDIYVDAYPGKVFKGRVSGFSPGTGASMSLLPPENATGNYVKVVQRLTVRIDLTEPNPHDTPLFVGLSAVPEVRVKEEPAGPHAGERLSRTGTTSGAGK